MRTSICKDTHPLAACISVSLFQPLPPFLSACRHVVCLYVRLRARARQWKEEVRRRGHSVCLGCCVFESPDLFLVRYLGSFFLSLGRRDRREFLHHNLHSEATGRATRCTDGWCRERTDSSSSVTPRYRCLFSSMPVLRLTREETLRVSERETKSRAEDRSGK